MGAVTLPQADLLTRLLGATRPLLVVEIARGLHTEAEARTVLVELRGLGLAEQDGGGWRLVEAKRTEARLAANDARQSTALRRALNPLRGGEV